VALSVRDALPADLPELVAIYNHAVVHTVATFDVEPFTVEQRQGWFAQFGAEHPLLVCETDSRIVGYACYLPYRAKPAYGRTKETTVYVAPGWQARGVGSALYEALCERARARGVHALLAVLAGDNPGSEALHRKFGFVAIGHLREVGHKFGAWVDTRYWEKIL
jgi:phosphinothricin acetyltransferase